MAAQVFKVGELAARAGVGVQTLHYYERLGLLPKAERTAANHRVYPSDALRRVEFVKKAQTLGFTLEEIKEIFALRDDGTAPCRRVVEFGEKKLQEIDSLLATLQELRNSLARAVRKWKSETARERCCGGEFCDLIERLPAISLTQSFLKKPVLDEK